MVSSQTKNPYLGIFWKALEWKTLINCLTIFNILKPFGYGLLVHIPSLWTFGCIFPFLVHMFEPRKIWQPWMVVSQLGRALHLFKGTRAAKLVSALDLLEDLFTIKDLPVNLFFDEEV
jgi:hypothetical protein